MINKKYRIISLIIVFLMMTATAITVNKTLFSYKLDAPDVSPETSVESIDTITTLGDGSCVIHTFALPDETAGYAGPVDMDIYIKGGKIIRIEPLPNDETPSFFSRASELFSGWIGKTPEEALQMKVDAVSGATYSSNAIISNVNAGLIYYEGSAAKNNTPATPWKMWIALAVTLTACVIPLFVKNKIYHNVQLIANVIVLGFWCGQYLDYMLILKSISSGFLLPAGVVTIVMLIAAFVYPLFGRAQYYCTHICPLGSAQQLAGELCGYKIHISPKVIKALDWFRKILWAVLMLLLWTDTLTGWMDLELFRAFGFETASWWIIGVAAFFILLSIIITRPYCRFVCPTGSLFKRAENIG